MKKIAIGCSIVVLVFAVIGMAASYWVYRKVSTVVADLGQLAEVPRLERQVRETGQYVPPASGELTVSQVERLVGVQARVRGRLGERAARFRQKYRTLMDDRSGVGPDLPRIVSAYRDLADIWLDAKRAQVEALNAASFSLEEYHWVRRQVYAALGLALIDVDVASLLDGLPEGPAQASASQTMTAILPSGSDRNRTVIEAFRQGLEENAALAAFGL